jgi:hypothetical protein
VGDDFAVPSLRKFELVRGPMFAFNVMSIWICSRELFRPRAIARWIETSTAIEFAARVIAFYRFDPVPALRNAAE